MGSSCAEDSGDEGSGEGDLGGESGVCGSNGSQSGDCGDGGGGQFGEEALFTYGLSGLYSVEEIVSSWRGWLE
jgi:hypothetical protein